MILVTLTSRCNCDFEHSNISLNENKLDGVDLNSNGLTLYNVCSVHWGMFGTSGGYHEYIGGIP